MRFPLVVALVLSLVAGGAGSWAAGPDIPRLDWQQRSDWISVKADVVPKAVGDGKADDTEAIQAALTASADSRATYLPPGTYRITKTLELKGPRTGATVIGHGRDTRIVWDGPDGGVMFWSNGNACSRYVGISWDGQNRAAVGFDHKGDLRFETEVRHEHEAFRNFKSHGIRIGNNQQIASAEILYRNCLFENCGTGLGMMAFNDYDNTVEGCEFRDCGTAISDVHGNFYARDTHFERSRVTDFDIRSEHGDSIRRCTSVGSRRFVTEGGGIAPVAIQDCQVAGWTDPEGAVFLAGSPVLLMDCGFTNPPNAEPPVKINMGGQQLIISGNQPLATEKLVRKGADAAVYVVPPGALKGVVKSAQYRFLRSTAKVPAKVCDAKRDFGAKGDGKADDTAAIQAAIDAARKAGKGAIAYLPVGHYVITKSLKIAGSDYAFGGGGYSSCLVWRGPEKGVAIEVADPQGITLEQFMVGHHDLGPVTCEADIRQTSAGGKSTITYDGVYAYGMYQKKPGKQGILFDNLPAGAVVHGIHTEGNLRFRNCARAKFLFGTSYEGTISVEGTGKLRDGFLGFMMRLETGVNPTVHIRDNQSLVMSDFYIEQSDRHLLLEGNPGDPPGRVTITGPKIHLNLDQPILEANGYSGQVYLGQDQFYINPKQPKFITTGAGALELILAGHFLYDAVPQFELSPATHLTLMANRGGPANQGLERPEAMRGIVAALDDLRRLGKVDLEVGGW